MSFVRLRSDRLRPVGQVDGVRGLTLIELLVALTIFSILGAMSYRAVSAATDRQSQLSEGFQRWRDISRFMQMTEVDMLQAVARPSAVPNTAQPSIVIDTASDTTKSGLSVLTLDGATGSVRRRGYWLEENRIVLIRWPVLGADSSVLPFRDVVLDNVTSFAVTAIGSDGQKSSVWPTKVAGNSALPVAIDVELGLPDAGTIHRLFVLR
jgi:general secretion pathway protein J